MDSRAPRDGKTLDEVGLYHPIEKQGEQLRIDEEKIQGWIKKGVQPSMTVKRLLNKNNIFFNREAQ